MIKRDLDRLTSRLDTAIGRTVEAGATTVRKRAPKAFGNLAGSVHTEGETKIIIDAPHAAAVEIGSAPHTPDLEALVAWVKLRGMQALTRPRGLHLLGSTTPGQATSVKQMLAAEVKRGGTGSGRGRWSPVDAPRQVALAIAKGIEAKGTKPHFFVRDALPEIAADLSKRIRRAVKK